MKAKEEKVNLKFQQLGSWKNLKLNVFADASLANVEHDNESRSVMGYFITLSNEENEFNPIHWKSKVIEKVAEDTKTAETLALENAVDDALYISSMITEIYSGENRRQDIPLVVHTDSKSLLESIYSTRKVKRKTMRVVISSLQQHLKMKRIKDVEHVSSKEQIADVLTKKGVANNLILETLETGKLQNSNSIRSQSGPKDDK